MRRSVQSPVTELWSATLHLVGRSMSVELRDEPAPSFDGLRDGELVEAARAGSHRAFAEIVERYQNLVFSLALAVTGSQIESEEIAQRVFVRAWEKLGELRVPDSLRAWLWGITRNYIRQFLRSRRSKAVATGAVPAGGEDAASPEPSPLDRAIEGEEQVLLRSALARIPKRIESRCSFIIRSSGRSSRWRKGWTSSPTTSGSGCCAAVACCGAISRP